jgi:hypothetical protein
MPVIKRTLKEGEFSTIEEVYERIRVFCNVDEETFYGSPGAAKHRCIQSDYGCYLIRGFLAGMWVMGRNQV